jgi:hypothetical protein
VVRESVALPHSLEAERSVLGAILIENSVYDVAAEVLQPSDFFRDAHRYVYECIGGLIGRSSPVDLVTVAESLERNGLLEEVGVAYLASLVDGIPRSTNVAHYAGIVKEKALHRRHIFEANKTIEAAYAEEMPAAELARAYMVRLAVIEAGGETAGARPVVVRLAEVRPEAIRWLWVGRLAFGKLTMLSGDPGLGKSFITMDLAARASTGRPWPDGAGGREPIDVLILAAEDGLADTVRPRLDALGADVARVHVMTGTREGRSERGPQLSDVDVIEKALSDTGARLLIIDPVSSYLGVTDSHKDAEVRGLLTPLLTMAERHDCAVLGVMHLTKDSSKAAIYRSSGSVAFVAQARVALMVTTDAADPDRRVLAASKCNVAKMPAGLAYTMRDGRLEWDATPLTDFDLNAHLSAASCSSGRDKDDQTDAEQVLSELLADESAWPMSAKDAIAAGEANGINERTMQRTARKLKIGIRRLGFGPGSRVVWNRPPSIPDTIPAGTLNAEHVSGMSSIQKQATNGGHTHIDDNNGPFPRAREDGPDSVDVPVPKIGGGRVSL